MIETTYEVTRFYCNNCNDKLARCEKFMFFGGVARNIRILCNPCRMRELDKLIEYEQKIKELQEKYDRVVGEILD